MTVEGEELDEVVDEVVDDDQVLEQRPLAERNEFIERLNAKEEARNEPDDGEFENLAALVMELTRRVDHLESIVAEELLRENVSIEEAATPLEPEPPSEEQIKWREELESRKAKIRAAAKKAANQSR